MGQFYTRDQNGFLRNFKIKGDAPSPTEQARIQNLLAGNPAPPTQAETEASQPGIFGTFMEGTRAGWDQLQAGLDVMGEGIARSRDSGTFLGSTADEYAEAAKDQRQQASEYNLPSGSFTEQDGIYNKIRYLAGTAGQTAPAMAGSTVATIGGAVIGGPPGAIAGFAGSTAFYAPQALNENAERQIEQHGYIKDWGKLGLATVAQSGVEAVTDRLTLGVSGLLKKPASALLKGAVERGTKKALTTIAKKAGAAGALSTVSGGLEEALQSMATRWQADLPLMDEKAQAEYIESAIVGGLLEGTIGATFGTVGGAMEARTDKAMQQANEDAKAEASDLSFGAARNIPANAARREPKANLASGQLEDLRPNTQINDFGESSLRAEGKLPYSPEEYTKAVEELRGETKVSPDKIKNKLKIGRPKATAIFNAIKERNDGSPVGSASQYVRIRPKREYLVAPLDEKDATPFSVLRNGKPIGNNRFKTDEEARAWAERAGIKSFEINNKTEGQRFGVYEVQKEGDRIVGKRAVKTFGTAGEANRAASELDPGFSIDSNVANDIAIEAERNFQISRAIKEELGPIAKNLQKKTDDLLGPGRVNVKATPSIDSEFMTGELGTPFKVDPSRVAEGVTLQGKNKISQVIGLASDIHDAMLTPDQRQQKMDDVLNHEFVHAVRGLGLLSKAEWKQLAGDVTQKVPGKSYNHLQWAQARGARPGTELEEAIAEMVRRYARDPMQFSKPQRSALGKIMDFVKKLIGLGQRYGSEPVMKAMFGGELAKREVGSGYQGNPFFSDVKVPGFYMKSAKVVDGASWKEARADQWMGMFRNAQIKTEEMEWLGIEDWLKEQQGPIKKGDVQDYIRANSVDMQERKATTKMDAERQRMKDTKNNAYNEMMFSYDNYLNSKREDSSTISFDDWKRMMISENHPAADLVYKAIDTDRAYLNKYPQTKHERVTQPGGEDYTEFLFYMPKLEPVFKHSHWPLDNVVAHARFKTRYIKGKKTLFIEEIQSDLHQIGREEGYAKRGPLTKAEQYEKESTWEAFQMKAEKFRQDDEAFEDTAWASEEEQQEEANHLARRMAELDLERDTWERKWASDIPDAPLKKTWDEFAFKRLVRYAVENGFEQLAWHGEPDSVAHTEGYHDMQRVPDPDGEDHYIVGARDETPEFEKKVHNGKERWSPTKGKDVTGIINLYTQRLRNWSNKYFKSFGTGSRFEPAEKIDGDVDISSMFADQEEFDLVMDDVARNAADPKVKAAANKGRQIAYNDREFDARRALEPILKVMTPEELSREISFLFPNAEVSTAIVPAEDAAGNPNYARWVMPVTEELKESVIKDGFPMFSQTAAFDEWFKDSKVVDAEGKPLRVYHGTSKDKDFDRFKVGQRGSWFTADPADASMYASDNDSMKLVRDEAARGWAMKKVNTASRVMPVYLSIKKPYMMDLDMLKKFNNQSGSYQKLQRNLFNDLRIKGYDGVKMGDNTWVAFHPEQIKSVFNSGAFSEKDPRIMYSATAPMGQRVPNNPPIDELGKVEANITYNNLAPVLQKLGRWLPQTSNGLLPGRHVYADAVEGTFINMQDRMLPVGKLIDRMKKNNGLISTETDTYLRETLFPGQTDAQLQDAMTILYTPLTDVIRDLKATSADAKSAANLTPSSRSIIDNYSDPKHGLAELYLYARHARERNKKMRERNANLKDIRPNEYAAGSGMQDQEADAILAWFASKPFAPQMQEIRNRFQKIISNTNDVRVAGELNPDFRTMTNQKTGLPVDEYKDYAPLRSWIEEHYEQDQDALQFAKTGKGFNIRGKEDQSAVGRETLGENLIAHAILQNEEAIVRANKNKVGKSFLNLIRQNPELTADVAEVIDVKPRKVVYDAKTGQARLAADNTLNTDPNILKVKEGGKVVYIKIKDPRIAKAMGARGGLGNAGAGSLMKMLLKLNNFLAATRTSYNPEFMVSNMLRDLGAALANLSENEQKGVRRKVLKSVLPALRGVYKGLRSGDMTQGWAKEFEEFRKMGGMTAFYGIRELDDTIRKVNEGLALDASGPMHKVKTPIKALGKFISDTNLAIENGTRLSAYVTLRDQFLSMTNNPKDPANIKRAKERAAFAAKNLTVNFNMGGEMKPVMNALYLFFNAGLQGSMALINPFIRSRKMKMIWGSVLAAGIAQDALMALLSPEDDDGKLVYDKIPDFVLEHNIIVMDPFGMTDRGYFKIPMPYLMNGIYNMGRGLTRSVRGGYTAGEAFNSIGGTLVESLNPWGGANSFLNFVAPTIADPIVDLAQNENFASEPIAPPDSPFGVNEKASQRYWNNTSPLYVTLAEWMSDLTGSDGDYLPGLIETYPNHIEYVWDWATGGTGTFVTRIYDLGASDKEFAANDFPFIRRAYGNVTTKNDLQSYIKNRDRVLLVKAELNNASQNGDSAHYTEVMQRYPQEYRLSVAISRIENARRKLSRQINKIRESNDIDDATKKRMVDELKKKQDELIGYANGLF